jgi:hypothetical protein
LLPALFIRWKLYICCQLYSFAASSIKYLLGFYVLPASSIHPLAALRINLHTANQVISFFALRHLAFLHFRHFSSISSFFIILHHFSSILSFFIISLVSPSSILLSQKLAELGDGCPG